MSGVIDCIWRQVFKFLTNSDVLVLCQAQINGLSEAASQCLFDSEEYSSLLESLAKEAPTPTDVPLHQRLPQVDLEYAGMYRRGNLVLWKAQDDHQSGLSDSLSHLTLDREFLQMPVAIQQLILQRSNHLLSLTVKLTFYDCDCTDCVAVRSSEVANDLPDESAIYDSYRVAASHVAKLIELAYKIVFRNYRTIQSFEIAGPSYIHMFKVSDQDIYQIPIPVRVDETNEMGCLVKSAKCPRTFTHLRSAIFGRTVDCRYIVPFIDNCDFPKLAQVSIGRLQVDVSDFPIVFGRLPFIVFGPQYISYEQTCESAPHLPALYVGCVDDQLRFQGAGVFVCDEYVYKGEFRNGLNHGYGLMKSVTGEIYDGDWSCGQRNGRGIVYQANGNVIMGNWLDDSLNGSGYAVTRRADHYATASPATAMNVPVWKIPRSFTYYGQWSYSNFNGWGTVSYNNVLLSYGLMNNGYFGKWVRCAKAIRGAGDDDSLNLVWEEHEHDQFGYVVKCYQIAINVPQGEAEEIIHGMDCSDLARVRTLIRNFGKHKSASSPTFNLTPSPHKNYLRQWRHGFPDEESPYTERHSTSPNSADRYSRASPLPLSACTPSVCSTIGAVSINVDVSRGFSPAAQGVRSPTQTPIVRSALHSSIPTSLTPRATPSGPGYDSIMREIPRWSDTNASSLECIDNESAFQEVEPVVMNEALNNEAAVEPQGRTVPKTEARDRSALVQAMEVVDEVLGFVRGDEAACDEILRIFGEFTRALFTRLHTDWLRADTEKIRLRLKGASRLNSPLPVPDCTTIPPWFKKDLLVRFHIVDEPLSIVQTYETFKCYLAEQSTRIGSSTQA